MFVSRHQKHTPFSCARLKNNRAVDDIVPCNKTCNLARWRLGQFLSIIFLFRCWWELWFEFGCNQSICLIIYTTWFILWFYTPFLIVGNKISVKGISSHIAHIAFTLPRHVKIIQCSYSLLSLRLDFVSPFHEQGHALARLIQHFVGI